MWKVKYIDEEGVHHKEYPNNEFKNQRETFEYFSDKTIIEIKKDEKDLDHLKIIMNIEI